MIELSNIQQNVVLSENTPEFQDWAPNPSLAIYYWSNNVPVMMTGLPIRFKVKDFFGLPETAQYSEINLRCWRGYSPGLSTTPVWISGVPNNGYPEDYYTPLIITQTGIYFDYVPSFSNLNQLAPGVYEFTRHFQIRGKKPNGVYTILDTYVHTIRLVVTNSLVTFSPSSLHFVHTQNTALPSRTITINGENWKLWAAPNFVLSSPTPGTTISEIINPYTGQTHQQITGTGEAEIVVTLTPYFNSSSVSTPYISQFTVIAGENTTVGYIPVQVDILNIGNFYVSPEALSFYAVKGIEEPEAQNLFVATTFPPYEFTCSPWLTAQIHTIELPGGIFVEVLKVVPIPTANMEPGVYQGEVKLNDVINDVPSEIIVPVTYKLDGFVTSPYDNSKFAFTLDPLFFLFSTLFENTFMQLTATMRIFDYNGLMSEKNILEKVPIYKGKGKINYGNIIHKMMSRFPNPNENSYQYQLAVLILFVEEINAETLEVLRDALLPEIKFVAGLSNRLPNNAGFLEFNQNPSRFTSSGFTYLNLIYPEGIHFLKTKLNDNDDEVETVELPVSSRKTILKKFEFTQYRQGDKIDVSLISPTNVILATKTFYILPEQKYSWHLMWQSEFLMQSIIQCTGSLSTKNEFEVRSNTVFQNLVEVLNYIETSKVDKLTISTGWILKTQLDEIESLLRSERVWLYKDEKKIELRPITKSIVGEDKERELIEFNLEFQINRSYDQETYRF